MAWQKKAQFVTVSQAMQKLEKFCTYQERSQKQVLEKCRELGLTVAEAGEVMIHLLQTDFLNEERYAIAYVRGKSKIKAWGKEKIKQGLKQAGISDALILQSLSLLEEATTDLQIEKWARKKLKAMKFQEEKIDDIIEGKAILNFEEKQKVKAFLMGKGFSIQDQMNALLFLKS